MVAIVAAAGLWFVLGSESGGGPVERGSEAPAFSLPRFVPPAPADPDGATGEGASAAAANPDVAPIDLASLAGRVVLVNFWATWCEPCEQEMPAMERLYQRLPRSDFELLAISIDEEPEKIGDFVVRYGLTFPILLDPEKKTSRAYQTMGVPESLLVDRDGRIVERYVGPREWDAAEYVDRIEGLIGDSGSATAP